MSSLLLGHEAAGFLCDGWQDKTSTMHGGIKESHLLKMKRKSRWSFIVWHLKYLRYESFLLYHVSLRMLLAQMLSWDGSEMTLKTLHYQMNSSRRRHFFPLLPSFTLQNRFCKALENLFSFFLVQALTLQNAWRTYYYFILFLGKNKIYVYIYLYTLHMNVKVLKDTVIHK